MALLSQVFSSSVDMKTDLKRETQLQESMDKDATCRSFSWKVFEQAKLTVGATTYVGATSRHSPFSTMPLERTQYCGAPAIQAHE